MAQWFDKYLQEQTDNTQSDSQVWDDADSSQNFRLKGGDAPEVFHDITPTGDTKNERSKVYKQIAALNNISEEEAIKQVDAEAEDAKKDPNLGLRIKTLRQSGAYKGPITSHEIYQLGKEATMATNVAEVGALDDRNNVLDAKTSFTDTQETPEILPAVNPNELDKGYFGRSLMDINTTNQMIEAGYFAPGADPSTAAGRKEYELQLKMADKAKRLGLGLWKDPVQAKIMESIVDTSYSQNKYLDELRKEGKSNLTGIDAIDESIDTVQGTTMKMLGNAAGLIGKGLSSAGEYNQDLAGKSGENYAIWEASKSIGDKLDNWSKGVDKYADAYFGANGSEGQMVKNVYTELSKGNFGDAVDEITLKDSIKLVAGMAPYVVGMMTGTGQAGLWASLSNEGIEEAKKESPTGTISKERTLAVLGASALSLGLEKLGIEALFKGKSPIEISKMIPKSVQTELVKKITKTGGLIAVETLTEPMQELLTVLSTQVGQQEGSLSDELKRVLSDKRNIDRLGEAAVGGTIAGGTIRGPIDAPGIALETTKTVGTMAGKAKDAVQKSIDKRDIAKANKRSAEQKIERVNTLDNQGIDYKSYSSKTKVEDSSEVFVDQKDGTESKLYVAPVNLRAEVNNSTEYEKVLEEHKDKVIQSLYEIDPVTKKIKGLSPEASELSIDELEARSKKVDDWLIAYEKEYTTNEKLREADKDIVNSITEDMVVNNQLNDSQMTELVISAQNKKLAGQELTNPEKQIMQSGGQKVNDILAEASKDSKVNIPKDIKKQVDYFTGPNAKVHLEEVEIRKQERQDAIDLETTATTLEDEIIKLEKSTNEENASSIETEIAKKKEEVANLRAQAELMLNNESSINKAMENKIVKDAKKAVGLDKLSETELVKVYTNAITNRNTTVENGQLKYNKGWSEERIKAIAEPAAARTRAINSKYNFDAEVEAEVDYEGLIAETENVKNIKDKVVESKLINGNEFAKSIIEGDAKKSLKDYNSNSTKLVHRILNKIGIASVDSKYPIARDLMKDITKAVNTDLAKDKLKTIFTEAGIADGEGVILLVNTLGAINAAIVTDTMARQRVESTVDSVNLAQNEYWASETNLITQIGKDFMTARGIKLSKGTPTQQLEQYRKIGAVALEIAIDNGLVEKSNGHVSSVLSERIVTDDNKTITSGTKGVSRTSLDTSAKELMNPKKTMKLNLNDYGIRLSDKDFSNKTINTATGQIIDYNSEVADIASRINKLLISSNLEIPKQEGSDYVKVADTVTPYKDGSINIVDTVVKLQNTPYQIKPSMMKILEKIKKEVDEEYEGNLDKYLSEDGKWAAEMLGINRYATESRILAFNDAGVSNGIKDSLRGIIDNLDSLKNDLYFTYQIDKNNRITIRETVLNFQADKVIARQILMPAGVDTFNMGSKEAALETQIDMLNELGFKAASGTNAKEDYNKAINIILSDDKVPSNLGELSRGEQIAWEVARILNSKTYSSDPSKIANRLNDIKSPLFTKVGGKKTIKGMAIIDGFRVMRESNGKKTNYMSETDAKASGVMNVLMNIIGFDVNAKDGELTVQTLLEQLGVALNDTDKTIMPINPKDAYNLLQDKVKEVLAISENDDIANEQYSDIRSRIAELDNLGIDTRELAKPPVMTWFYTAGTETIVKELAETLLEDVFRMAMEGNKDAIAHINTILGIESNSPLKMKSWKIGGTEHKALMDEYRKIGELYESQLKQAFPAVEKFKKTMEGMFKTIESTGYANGIIDSSAGAVYGGKSDGKFNIYQEKQYVQELTDEKIQGKVQLKKDAEAKRLVTSNKLMSNFTSLIPLMAQGVDFTILEKTMRELYAKYGNEVDFSPMTVHDAIYTPLKYMLETGKDSYNRTIVDVANRYDFADTIITYAKDTLASMEEARSAMTSDEKVDHNIKIDNLKSNIVKWEKENGARIEYKKAKLKGNDGKLIETDLMGGTDIKQETENGITETVDKTETSKTIGPRDVLINQAKGMSIPFAEVTEKELISAIEQYQKAEFGESNKATLEEYAKVLGTEATITAVAEKIATGDRLTELRDVKEKMSNMAREEAINDFRKNAEKNPSKAVNDLINTLVGLGNVNAVKMQQITQNRTIEWAWGDEFSISKSDSKDAKITIGKNTKELTGVDAILDRIGHELEHANSATLIKDLSEGKGSDKDKIAYRVIAKALDKVKIDELDSGKRLARVMQEKETHKQVAEFVAVVRGETIGSEQLIQEMLDKGFLESVVDKVIEYAKTLIAMVRNKKSLEVNDVVDMEQLLQAVEQIHRSGLENQETTIAKSYNYEAESKQQKDKISKKEMAQELRNKLTKLMNGKKIPSIEAILNKIKDC